MARRNGGEISHFRRAETAPFNRQNSIQIDVPRKKTKKSKTISRLKVQKVPKICYAAAGKSRYRLINVAPTK